MVECSCPGSRGTEGVQLGWYLNRGGREVGTQSQPYTYVGNAIARATESSSNSN